MACRFPPLEHFHLTPLAEREVQVWHVAVELQLMEFCRGLVTHDELERFGRMRACTARDESLVARGSLRFLLAHELGCEPQDVAIHAGAEGKPRVSGVEFNVSHSRGHILIAICHDAAVGVDLEWIEAAIEVLELVQANFASTEIQTIQSHSPGVQRVAAFYDCWTKKEALVKAHGAGLTIPLQSFATPIGRSEETKVTLSEPTGKHTDLFVRDVLAPAGFAAALAVARPEYAVRHLRFPGAQMGTKRAMVTPVVLPSGDGRRTQVELAAPPKLHSLNARQGPQPFGSGVFTTGKTQLVARPRKFA